MHQTGRFNLTSIYCPAALFLHYNLHVCNLLAVRYAWIDTSAVSIGWGPRHKGRGGVGPGKLVETEKGRNDVVPQVFQFITHSVYSPQYSFFSLSHSAR